MSHHNKTSDWLLQPSIPFYDLDNNYGGFMGKQKDPLSRLEMGLSITQYWVLIGSSHNGLQWDPYATLATQLSFYLKEVKPNPNMITS